jgi:hypothetical protein
VGFGVACHSPRHLPTGSYLYSFLSHGPCLNRVFGHYLKDFIRAEDIVLCHVPWISCTYSMPNGLGHDSYVQYYGRVSSFGSGKARGNEDGGQTDVTTHRG